MSATTTTSIAMASAPLRGSSRGGSGVTGKHFSSKCLICSGAISSANFGKLLPKFSFKTKISKQTRFGAATFPTAGRVEPETFSPHLPLTAWNDDKSTIDRSLQAVEPVYHKCRGANERF